MNEETKKEELFRRFLDGELDRDEQSRALHMIADDPDMIDVLRLERTLFRVYGNDESPDSFTVPDHFSDSVMQSISEKLPESQPDKDPASLFSLISNRKITLNPVYATAAVILLSLSFGYFFTNRTADNIGASGESEVQVQNISQAESEIWIRFVYFDEDAESIEVAGDFSDWDPIELSREFVGDKQVWTGLMPVTRGEHRYMFLKDGEEWVTDPLAEVQRDDGFGNKNAVLYL